MSYKFNPLSGQLDYYEEGGSADDANRIEVTRKVDGVAVTKYDPVALITATEVIPSNVDTLNNATVFGLALEDAAIGQDVRILIFGIVSDSFFTFPLNDPLFNSVSGAISATATTIVGEFFCQIGKSNGLGSILVDPSKPTEVS